MPEPSRSRRENTRSSAALGELRSALEHGWGSQSAIEEILEQGLCAQALEILRDALANSEAGTRAEACLALGYLDDPIATSDLRPMIDDSNAMVALRAADTLCQFGEPAAAIVPRLTDILRSTEAPLPQGKDRIVPPCMMLQMPEEHYHAARILSYYGDEAAPAREALRQALGSASATVRAAAATALAAMDEPSDNYLFPLRQALHDRETQSSRERVWAAEALVELGEPPESVVAVLAELVSDDDWTAFSYATRFLGTLGTSASAAIPALQKASESKTPAIAHEATVALERLGVKIERTTIMAASTPADRRNRRHGGGPENR